MDQNNDKIKHILDAKGNKIRMVGRYWSLVYATHLPKEEYFNFFLKTIVEKNNMESVIFIAHFNSSSEHPFDHTRVIFDAGGKIDWGNHRKFNYKGVEPWFYKVGKLEWQDYINFIRTDPEYYPPIPSENYKMVNSEKLMEVNTNLVLRKCINFDFCHQYLSIGLPLELKSGSNFAFPPCNKCQKNLHPTVYENLHLQSIVKVENENHLNDIQYGLDLRRLNESLDPEYKLRDIINLYLTVEYKLNEKLNEKDNQILLLQQNLQALQKQNNELTTRLNRIEKFVIKTPPTTPNEQGIIFRIKIHNLKHLSADGVITLNDSEDNDFVSFSIYKTENYNETKKQLNLEENTILYFYKLPISKLSSLEESLHKLFKTELYNEVREVKEISFPKVADRVYLTEKYFWNMIDKLYLQSILGFPKSLII